MAPSIQANSLSSLVNLASNPPISPRDPTIEAREPLLLYIARVPGTKDIFLTTQKPRTKTITAEDISSSLYYLHMNTPEDEELSRSSAELVTEHIVEDAFIEEKPANIHPVEVHRKPIPLSSNIEHNVSLEYSSDIPPQQPPRTISAQPSGVHRKPLPTHLSRSEGTPVIASPSRPIQDLPLRGPRPLPQRPSSEATSDLRPPYSQSSHLKVITPPLPLRPLRSTENIPRGRFYSEGNVTSSAQDFVHNGQASPMSSVSQATLPLSPSNAFQPSEPRRPYSITLIRRDPSSGLQWNVGTISNTSNSPASHPIQGPDSYPDPPPSRSEVYLCISHPGYTKFLPPKFPARKPIASSTAQQIPADLLPAFTRVLHIPSPHSRSPTRSRNFSFHSPWDGVCEFVTGLAGRSLKCKHTLTKSSAATQVSEIRFNLPSRKPHARTSSYAHTSPHPSPAPASASDDEDQGEDQDPSALSLGLSLGREVLGGGKGGRRTKLGKLIVQAEGLAMLDLLVAANMALWWRAWDGSLR
ncbi:MAG: hypothetical protein M1829_000926 [Trizodia sp. TS-e1964]|nr:MAG: hypothetical protein M1829_000926 [Trizodia sp. TS-e1964]